ncbi:hypothetical protein NP233_g10208 [Leucocoprinus birnbaumii]|uniref:Uncharacterized protein n=1 Tax=Leucocoprinus birnbaumii TaxID=56174 RepID=A0AAD5YQ32_9AGAR|nr:hypothetical protein NP233_g10208 [Leucocoprinus birnbaumii]
MSATQQTSPVDEPVADQTTPAHVASGYFAFANIRGVVCLVQVSTATPASPLTTMDVKIFRHEFINIFRFAETCTLHPTDITILENIDDSLKRYEEDTGTVYLSKEVMSRLRNFTDARFSMTQNRDFDMTHVSQRRT